MGLYSQPSAAARGGWVCDPPSGPTPFCSSLTPPPHSQGPSLLLRPWDTIIRADLLLEAGKGYLASSNAPGKHQIKLSGVLKCLNPHYTLPPNFANEKTKVPAKAPHRARRQSLRAFHWALPPAQDLGALLRIAPPSRLTFQCFLVLPLCTPQQAQRAAFSLRKEVIIVLRVVCTSGA